MVERGRVGERAPLSMPDAYECVSGLRQEVAKVPGLFEPYVAFMGPELPYIFANSPYITDRACPEFSSD